MNSDNAVLRIDLAPSLKRPLSLWNPLDYLRLLYWVFYFPQALRWYEEKFSNGVNSLDAKTFQQRWQWLRQNPIQQRLILQSLIVLFVIDFGSAKLLETLGFRIAWLNVTRDLFIGVFFGLIRGLSLGITGDVAWCVIWGIAFSISGVVASTVASGVIFGTALGIASVTSWGLASGLAFGLARVLAYGIVSCTIIGVILGMAFDPASVVAFGMAFSMAFLRLESWFLGNILCFSKNYYLHLSHISPIPVASTFKRLTNDLEKDWENSLQNTNQLLAYTLQYIPVLQAINFVLAITPPAQLLPKTSLLAQQSLCPEVVKFASASWSNELKYNFVHGLFILPGFLKKRLTHHLSLGLRTDTPARAAAAGFWYLHQKSPARALQSFLGLQYFPYGKEMCLLSEALMLYDQLIADENPVSTIANTSLSLIPSTPHLHPDSWIIIADFQQVITDIKIVETSNSRNSKSLALNRALGQLDKILKQSSKIVTAEKNLITKIAAAWQKELLTVTSKIGEVVISERVVNPYTIGDPVEGDAFVGREDIINQLAELWRQNKSVQSVVLYGHRRMGKTSILRNINHHLGKDLSLAYVNMLLITNPQGETDILMFICDQIAIATNIATPTNNEFSDFPQTTCRRYIQEVTEKLGQRKLIIAIDEFEVIDTLIADRKISPEFLAFLRGLVQISPHIAFAFAGLHTLEERVANYSDPFFASFIPIPVGFLSLGATRQLLANPADPDFPLDYTPETLDNIYQLTAGQPYLTQLVGFQLVRHYNQQVFESGHTRDPIFTLDDLNTVIQDPVFFDRGRYYFTGVWNQASQDVPHQQTILTALAPHPTGLTLSELSTATNLTLPELNAALKVLERHDVAVCEKEKWRISIELFRRWVIDQLYA
jgi:AAA ATPase domain